MSEPSIELRRASIDDLEELCHLYFEFHEFHVLGVPNRLVSLGRKDQQDWSRLRQTLTQIFSDSDAAIWVADLQGKVIGLVEVYLRQDDFANPLIIPYWYGYIQSLIVTESYRRFRVGSRLLDIALEWAKERGAKEIRLDIWEFETGPLIFYQKAGYRTLKRTMYKEI